MQSSKVKPYYYELRDALAEPGCPFCRLLVISSDRYLDAVLWEMVNDPGQRSELKRARGYCQTHGWLLVRAGAALGIAILMKDVVKTLLDVLDEHPVGPRSESTLQRLLPGLRQGRASRGAEAVAQALSPQTPCPACANQQVGEAYLIETLWEHLEGDGSLVDLYGESDGLCMQHLLATLAHAPSDRSAGILLAVQQSIWDRLHADLAEFIRKNDQRFRDEPFGSEGDSWRRALGAISGAPPSSRSERQGLTSSS